MSTIVLDSGQCSEGMLKYQNKHNKEMEIVRMNVQHEFTKQHETIGHDDGEGHWKTKLKEAEAKNESLMQQVEKLNEASYSHT